jgi:hypothetical protein
LIAVARNDLDGEKFDLEIGFSLTCASNANVRIAGSHMLTAGELPAVDTMATIVRPGTRSAAPISRVGNVRRVMIKIYGIPISVHTRKAIVSAILKNIDYSLEGAVIPFIPPRNWTALSRTGLIPVVQDGEFSTAESASICVYLERKKADPARRRQGIQSGDVLRRLFRLDIPHL